MNGASAAWFWLRAPSPRGAALSPRSNLHLACAEQMGAGSSCHSCPAASGPEILDGRVFLQLFTPHLLHAFAPPSPPALCFRHQPRVNSFHFVQQHGSTTPPYLGYRPDRAKHCNGRHLRHPLSSSVRTNQTHKYPKPLKFRFCRSRRPVFWPCIQFPWRPPSTRGLRRRVQCTYPSPQRPLVLQAYLVDGILHQPPETEAGVAHHLQRDAYSEPYISVSTNSISACWQIHLVAQHQQRSLFFR